VTTATFRLYRFTPQTAGLLVIASAAWLATVYRSQSVGAMDRTMGMALPSFVGVWTLMMTAMMLLRLHHWRR
jgi:hypothetical protein